MSEIQRRTGLSRPTLQKYKFEYADRIPSVGSGRTQRYPEEAVDAILAIREENRSRVGRPAMKDEGGKNAGSGRTATQRAPKGRGKGKSAKSGSATSSRTSSRTSSKTSSKVQSKGSRKPAGAAQAPEASSSAGLLTLTELARRVGVSLPTARRYVSDHLERIAHEGEGRGKRFYEEAVATLRRVQKEAAGRRGRRGKGRVKEAEAPSQAMPSTAKVSKLVARLEALEARVVELERELERPLRLEIRR
jgi:predicted DNA-binding transcriptional regulator AlpA